jgi:phenylacetate-coenzyme A ligase PaaK-like adenylate-forming protein
MPLIRYELSDSVAVSNERCECGLPFPLLETIQGRDEDFVYLPSQTGEPVAIHPNVFHGVLEPLPLIAWQVEQEPEALRIRIVGAPNELADADIARAIERALSEQHAGPVSVNVERVDRIERTALGKFPLVKALRPRA